MTCVRPGSGSVVIVANGLKLLINAISGCDFALGKHCQIALSDTASMELASVRHQKNFSTVIWNLPGRSTGARPGCSWTTTIRGSGRTGWLGGLAGGGHWI